MTFNKNKFKILALGVLLILFVSLYVQYQKVEAVSAIKQRIDAQQQILSSLATLTDRNGTDAVTDSIIKDCKSENREKFDRLLSTLADLPYNDIVTVNQLFDGCGSYYAERKSLMVARLEQEFRTYKDYVSLLTIVQGRSSKNPYPLEQWQELITLEKERSKLGMSLVTIQKEIITLLLDGVSTDAPKMLEKIAQAQEVQDTLSYTGIKIDTLREGIIHI